MDATLVQILNMRAGSPLRPRRDRGGGGARKARIGAVLAAVTLLSGCAAQVSGVRYEAAVSVSPSEILVEVADIPSLRPDIAAAERAAATLLEQDLLSELRASSVPARAFAPGAARANAAVLRVTIAEADPGDALKRLVVGFGAGRAVLEARADLQIIERGGAHDLVGFDTESDSGRRPGLILPGGVALATGDAVHLAIGGGLTLAGSLRGSLRRPVRKTAVAVVGEIKRYYAAVGWHWPAG